MAAPGVFGRIADETSPDWIAVDVTHQGQQVGIDLDQPRAVAPLEQVAGGWDAALLAASVNGRDDLHQASQGRSPHLHGQMDVVRHPTVSMQTGLVPREVRNQNVLEGPIVARVMENHLAMVSAQDRVIETTGHMDARTAGHRRKTIGNRSGAERGPAQGSASPRKSGHFDEERKNGAGVSASGRSRRNRNRNTGTSN
jgi:hypothetical protein